MGKYFLIESQSPFESTEVNYNYELALNLANSGHEVTLFLVENGVLAARSTDTCIGLTKLSQVNLLADKFSLQERGIEPSEIGSNIKISSLECVVDAMGEGQKMMWL